MRWMLRSGAACQAAHHSMSGEHGASMAQDVGRFQHKDYLRVLHVSISISISISIILHHI